MKGVKQPFGYTIVELMIVLAVSGAMFAIAANFISGKQETASFQQGSNELVSRLQGIIEEITDGQYTDIRMDCVTTASGAVSISLPPTASTKEQGQNPNCVFLGKMLHFKKDGDSTKYEIFSMAGARLDSSGDPVDLKHSGLVPIDSNVGAAVAGASGVSGINLTRQYTTPQNLQVLKIKVTPTSGAANEYYGFGFMQGLGVAGKDLAGNKDGTFKSGSQSVSMVYAPIDSNSTEVLATKKVNQTDVDYAKSVCIPIYDGVRGAFIYVGSDTESSRLAVTIKQLGRVGSGPIC